MNFDWKENLAKFCGTTPHADTPELLVQLESFFSELAEEYNRTVSQEPLMITVRRMTAPDRLMVSTLLWSISLRCIDAFVECFLVPAAELSALMEAELPSRCKLRLLLESKGLMLDGSPLSVQELITLMRSLVKDLITRSQGQFEQLPDSVRLMYGGQSLTGSVRSLVAEKHVLVQKIVNQQEAILSQVARELHDTVLGHMMVLERSLTGGRRMPDAEMILLVREAAVQLREVCHDLYPRDLKDCGLAVMLQELCTKLHERIGCDCEFVCQGNMPDLTDEVQLHIYRIAQECCNNIAKHSSASKVKMTLCVEGNLFSLVVADDGKGFEHSSVTQQRSGGTGSSIIRERTELIDCVLPASLWVNSSLGEGTTVTLRIENYGAGDGKKPGEDPL